MTAEIARLMVAFGVVAAAVGFTFVGMATSYVVPHETMFTWGLALMIGGGLVAIVGWLVHRATDEADNSTR
jgi:hypothetical protein